MKLREIRLSKGMTQQAVSEYLDCAPSVYCRYETGDRVPSIDVLIKLSKCFGVSVDYIIGVDKVPSFDGLTEYEIQLIEAYRQADERAKADAMKMLLDHKITQ